MSIVRPIKRPLVRKIIRSIVGDDLFSIGVLFSSGEDGAYYDLSDDDSVFQDTAGTTPAGDGDPIGLIQDQSPNGNDATQGTAADQTTRVLGDHWHSLNDGTKFLDASSITLAHPFTIILVASVDGTDSNQRLTWGEDSSSAAAATISYIHADGVIRVFNGSSLEFSVGTQPLDPMIISVRFDGANSSFRVNGQEVTGNTGDRNLEQNFILGARSAGDQNRDGRMWQFMAREGRLTDTEVRNVEDEFKRLSPVNF